MKSSVKELQHLRISSQELLLHIEKTSHEQVQVKKVIIALARKKARGKYTAEWGRKRLLPALSRAAQNYAAQQGAYKHWAHWFPVDVRKQAAVFIEKEFRKEYAKGMFEGLLPRKYQKGATKKKTCSVRASSLTDGEKDMLKHIVREKGLGLDDVQVSELASLNGLVKKDLVTEGKRKGQRFWRANVCGKKVYRQVK